MLLNGLLLYHQGCLSNLFCQKWFFLVAFLCERSYFVKIWKITKWGPLDNITTTLILVKFSLDPFEITNSCFSVKLQLHNMEYPPPPSMS